MRAEVKAVTSLKARCQGLERLIKRGFFRRDDSDDKNKDGRVDHVASPSLKSTLSVLFGTAGRQLVSRVSSQGNEC